MLRLRASSIALPAYRSRVSNDFAAALTPSAPQVAPFIGPMDRTVAFAWQTARKPASRSRRATGELLIRRRLRCLSFFRIELLGLWFASIRAGYSSSAIIWPEGDWAARQENARASRTHWAILRNARRPWQRKHSSPTPIWISGRRPRQQAGVELKKRS